MTFEIKDGKGYEWREKPRLYRMDVQRPYIAKMKVWKEFMATRPAYDLSPECPKEGVFEGRLQHQRFGTHFTNDEWVNIPEEEYRRAMDYHEDFEIRIIIVPETKNTNIWQKEKKSHALL